MNNSREETKEIDMSNGGSIDMDLLIAE